MSGTKRGAVYVLALFVPYILIVGSCEYIGVLLTDLELTPRTDETFYIKELVISFFGFIGTFCTLWIFMRYVDKMPFLKLGFYTRDRFKDFTVGFILGFVIMMMGYSVLYWSGEIQYLQSNLDFKNMIVGILLFSIVSIVEEMLFRGYVLRNLMITFNKYGALILSSILFSLLHGMNPNIDTFAHIDLFLAGVLLGSAYLYTKNLWFPIGLHLSWNLFQSLLGFNVSGQEFYSIVEFSVEESNLWNGGAFGFEGSLLSVFFQIIAIQIIVSYYSVQQKKQKALTHHQKLKQDLKTA